MFRTTTAALALAMLACVNLAHAAPQDRTAAETIAMPLGASAPLQAGEVDWSLAPVRFGPPSRGSLLPALYGSLAALNAFDAYTTSKGVSLGAIEANPVLKGIAGTPVALWAVKGGVTAGSMFMAERLWRKKNRVGAVAVMLASNGIMAVVAARNVGVIRRQQAQ